MTLSAVVDTNVTGSDEAGASLGRRIRESFEAVRATLGDAQFAGCNSIGQIARSEGQMSGFHNCTAVVCVIPE